MKTLTLEILRSYKPCYDPIKYFDEKWSGTVVDILKDDRISHEDRLWCALRTDLVSEKCMRLFAVWSARQVQHLMKDPRSLNALDVAERFANGEATNEEMNAARAAAWAAAGDAARAAAGAAAWDAAWDAQRAKLIAMIEAKNKPEILNGGGG